MDPEPADLERFKADLDALTPPGARLGVALSGGSDSLALVILTAAARPGEVEAATVDHALRNESRAEAEAAAAVCKQLGVPHAILTAEWTDKPATAIQERARAERYRLLAAWANERGLEAILTGHHADDQAETLLMRLNRGAGVRGLAGMRSSSTLPLPRHSRESEGSRLAGGKAVLSWNLDLLRPLLTWRRADLERICAEAGLAPIADPSNTDDRFERVRVRNALADADWLNPSALAASAAHLASADEALDWAVDQEWRRAVSEASGALIYTPSGAPPEILRRLVARAIATLAYEGSAEPLRARELDPLIAILAAGRQATLRGVRCHGGGDDWRFSRAPQRRGWSD